MNRIVEKDGLPMIEQGAAISDRKLPGLERARDEEYMREVFLASGIARMVGREPSLKAVRHRILKYTPGKRCVLEYELHFEGEENPVRIIAKLYRKNRGERIFHLMQQIWQMSREVPGEREPFGMPQPLQYLSQLGMLLQTALEGILLAEFSPSTLPEKAVREVGYNLAALHRLTLPDGEVRSMADHLRKYCHPGPEVLQQNCPQYATLIRSILHQLTSENALKNAPITPVHGDVGLTQVFLRDGRAYFIDFDGLCLSHPALDVANFWVVLGTHFPSRGEHLQQIFLEAYRERISSEMLTGMAYYQALAYLRRAMIRFRQREKPTQCPEEIAELLQKSYQFLRDEF